MNFVLCYNNVYVKRGKKVPNVYAILHEDTYSRAVCSFLGRGSVRMAVTTV